MTLPKLMLVPQEKGFSYQTPDEVLETIMDGASPRKRFNKVGELGEVNCNLILTPFEYEYFMAFYKTKIKTGVLPFLMDLKTESSTLSEHTCFFKENSLKFSPFGTLYKVDFSLKVKPLN